MIGQPDEWLRGLGQKGRAVGLGNHHGFISSRHLAIKTYTLAVSVKTNIRKNNDVISKKEFLGC